MLSNQAKHSIEMNMTKREQMRENRRQKIARLERAKRYAEGKPNPLDKYYNANQRPRAKDPEPIKPKDNTYNASDLTPEVASIVDHAQRSTPGIIVKLANRITEYFPIHLLIPDLNELSKIRPLSHVEKSVLYMASLMGSKNDALKAVGIRLLLMMQKRNEEMDAKQLRLVPKSIVPENCLPAETAQTTAIINAGPAILPPIRYQLRLPDNKRGPNRNVVQAEAVQ